MNFQKREQRDRDTGGDAHGRRATGLPRSLEETLVIHEVLSAVRETIACERPLVLLQDEEPDLLWLHVGMGDETIRLPASEPSVLRKILLTGRSELVNDVVADQDTSPLLAERLRAHQLVATPLSAGGRRIGVIGAINSKHGAFNQEDLVRLSALAEQAALAIENSQLRTTMQRQKQEIEGLHRMTRLMASSEGVDQVVSESVRIVADLLECEKVALLLFDGDTNALVAHEVAFGMPPTETAGFQVSLAEPSLAGTVYRTDSPLISNDAANDAWVNPSFQEMLGIDTILIVPLTTSSDPRGVLCTINAHKRHFTEEDARLATLLGSRIAGVIEVSEARERERALMQKLRESDHTKTEFVSMLAHELKGPMTTVVGFGQVLRDQWAGMTDEKREHILDIISRETGRLSRLVTDLLDLSRIEAGTLRYEMSALSLHDLVRTILEVHTSLTENHGVVDRVPEDLPAVWGDPDRLRQVLINLITNATRYSPEGTTVTVGAWVEDDLVFVSITDEGIGIAPEDQEKVFGKFVMLDKPGWVKKGTGLGLYITKGIVEAHGGNLWVEPGHGRGSDFRFTLHPAAQRGFVEAPPAP